jgi:hypothetical protein
LTDAAIRLAPEITMPALYLLTTTAERFFPEFGFERIDRRGWSAYARSPERLALRRDGVVRRYGSRAMAVCTLELSPPIHAKTISWSPRAIRG